MKKIQKSKMICLFSMLCLLLFTSCGTLPDGAARQNTQNTEAQSQEAQNQQTNQQIHNQGTQTAPEPETETLDSTLEVHYIDVGQGDATLITCDGHAMLIDAGNNDKGTAVQSYLMHQNVAALDYVIATHPDADHIGGLDVVITKFDCGTIFMTDDKKDTATYRDVIDAMDYRGYTKTTPVVGNTYTLGDASFTIVGPTKLGVDSNGNSIAILLQHGNNRFYFEGDAEEQEEADILSTGIDISADVYKTGHHGSKTSTSDALLAAVHPQYAVISAGAGNKYGHPNAETLNKLRAGGVSVFRTDEQGTIVATSDGSAVTWNCSPSESWQAGEPTGSSTEDPGSGENETGKQVQENTDADTNVAASASQSAVVENSAAASSDTNADVTVHITKTGTKYHAAGCRYLKDSDIEVSLSEAKDRGYTPCSVCKPPQ